MKKVLIVLIIVLACTATLPATTNMLNIGLSVGPYGNFPNDEYVTRDVTLSWIRLGSDTFGFYSQLTPYYTMSWKNTETDYVWKASETDYLGVGIETILGYGGDFNFGSMGLIVGAGGYLDFNYTDCVTAELMMLTVGVGAGANFYFQPTNGNFLINAGLAVAWKPYYTYQNLSTDFSESDFVGGRFDVNLSVGIGMRTGGSSRSRRDSSGPSGGGDDDW